jgi:hypothetical protein
MICRGCKLNDLSLFLDLGFSPISNELIEIENSNDSELSYPLKVFVCNACGFVQTPEITSREILFSENYVYYSSYSSSWLQHSAEYVRKMIELFALDSSDSVIEIASNDGYLLQYFRDNNVGVLGVEPSSQVAQVAQEKGIDTVVDFFGSKLASELKEKGFNPRLMVANNVLAHVPDIHDFVAGFAILLSEGGVATFEFPHLSKLIENNEFDTIYHEHYSYLSLESLKPVFEKHNLEIFDVEFLPTHGGSLRIYASQIGSRLKNEIALDRVAELEQIWSPRSSEVVADFRFRSLCVKLDLLSELIRLKASGKKVVGYGAAAKGNTLLNYCGIDSDLLKYVVDLNPAKQNRFLPGSHIPIVHPEALFQDLPDVILILPWNLVDEISIQLRGLLPAQVEYMTAIPSLRYL